MKKAINGISIREGKLLLFRKKDVWILPGGKPEPKDLSPVCTLERELNEEYSGCKFKIYSYYKTHVDKTPHSNLDLEASAYFVHLLKDGVASSEIGEAKYIGDFHNYNISKITKKFIDSLIKDNYLKNGN